MSVVYEKIVAEDLELGRGTVAVTNPAGGTLVGSKIGIHSFLGTALDASDFALSIGWGTSAMITSVKGTDTAWQITIDSEGTGQAANPTITLTFRDGLCSTYAIALSKQTGGTGDITDITDSTTPTTWVMTFNGTPDVGSTYIISGISIGR